MAAAVDSEEDEEDELDEVLFINITRIAINKKRIPNPNVNQETIFSDPLSFVLAKTFNPPPVIAPEAPSDLPPWRRERTITINEMMIKIISYQCIILFT